MDQIQRGTRWWPSWGSSVTFSVYFRGRQTEGTGNFVTLASIDAQVQCPDLGLVFATGSTEGVTANILVDLIVQHLLNGNIGHWWCPPGGLTLAEALYKGFDGWAGPASDGSTGVSVFFDGQFGGVYTSR